MIKNNTFVKLKPSKEKLVVGIVFTLLLSLLLCSAETIISEIHEANKNINLTFICTINGAIPSATTTFNITITKINGEMIVNNQDTTALGQGSFIYPINFTDSGIYIIQEFCYDGTYKGSNIEYIEITPYGKSGTTNLVFYIFIAVILFVIGFIGFFGKNIYISALGGFGLMAFGLYTIREGLIIYQNWFTNAFSYITIGLGGIFTVVALVEYIETM